MSRNLIIAAVVFAAGAVFAGCPTKPGAHMTCQFTGAEKHVLYFNGAPMGVFEELTPPAGAGGKLTLRRGILSDGALFHAWLKHNETNPPIPEEHDLYVAEIHDGKWDDPETVFRDSNITKLDGDEARGNANLPGCWRVGSVEFTVRSVESVRGVITR